MTIVMVTITHHLPSDHRFSYEAAVCGGIPVINALQTDFVADDINKVMGIMNGKRMKTCRIPPLT